MFCGFGPTCVGYRLTLVSFHVLGGRFYPHTAGVPFSLSLGKRKRKPPGILYKELRGGGEELDLGIEMSLLMGDGGMEEKGLPGVEKYTLATNGLFDLFIFLD